MPPPVDMEEDTQVKTPFPSEPAYQGGYPGVTPQGPYPGPNYAATGPPATGGPADPQGYGGQFMPTCYYDPTYGWLQVDVSGNVFPVAPPPPYQTGNPQSYPHTAFPAAQQPPEVPRREPSVSEQDEGDASAALSSGRCSICNTTLRQHFTNNLPARKVSATTNK